MIITKNFIFKMNPQLCALFSFVIVTSFVQNTHAYCWQAGRNPGFSDKPLIQQIDISTVRVSWKDVVLRRECADQFLVKYWPKTEPNDYETSELVETNINYIDVKVTPKIPYMFQAVAREDKGLIGADWNKSPIAEFRTSAYNRDKAVEIPNEITENPKQEASKSQSSANGNQNQNTLPREPQKTASASSGGGEQSSEPFNPQDEMMQIAGLSIGVFIGIIVGALILLLIVVGVIYNVACKSKGKFDVEEAEDSSDSDEEEQEELKKDIDSGGE